MPLAEVVGGEALTAANRDTACDMLSSIALKVIAALSYLMHSYSSLKVTIEGHTDNRVSGVEAASLSKKRTDAVAAQRTERFGRQREDVAPLESDLAAYDLPGSRDEVEERQRDRRSATGANGSVQRLQMLDEAIDRTGWRRR